MSPSVAQGFTKSLAMTVLSEIGDKTFVAAAILAMRYPRRHVLSGCLGALIVMTILSAVVGWAAPNLNADITCSSREAKESIKFHIIQFDLPVMDSGTTNLFVQLTSNIVFLLVQADDDDGLKKKHRPFLTQFFSPILLKAFSITFFGEWGDKTTSRKILQLATIGLAAEENPLGGILGQALCTMAAVFGGKSLATQISEKIVSFPICVFLCLCHFFEDKDRPRVVAAASARGAAVAAIVVAAAASAGAIAVAFAELVVAAAFAGLVAAAAAAFVGLVAVAAAAAFVGVVVAAAFAGPVAAASAEVVADAAAAAAASVGAVAAAVASVAAAAAASVGAVAAVVDAGAAVVAEDWVFEV
ncbi:hypothetical protein SASPL_107915 [Salvia splendens]|uniref:GDT1 family protein n=1 Tax=Salvia splendens TaxID=180675 RepID=A0A8X8YH49_SALSN|nr:hypothetical protein SASPL_107915 [Salvia splendens]